MGLLTCIFHFGCNQNNFVCTCVLGDPHHISYSSEFSHLFPKRINNHEGINLRSLKSDMETCVFTMA